MAGNDRPRLLLATRSAGKLRELTPLLAALGFEAESLAQAGVEELPDEAFVESGETFEANALAKARYFRGRSPGRVVLAEDSGLCVDALGGGPGVRSKRWAGTPGVGDASLGQPRGETVGQTRDARIQPAVEETGDETNNARLLRALSGVEDRRAHYACCAALVWDGGELVASGMTRGRILEAPCGAEGFGYDPLFWSTELHACFGAISRARKASVSHRRRAVEAVLTRFLAALSASLAGPVDPERGAM